MKKVQVKENIITKVIIGICVVIFLFIFYDVLIKGNCRTSEIENRIESKIDDVQIKTDKILQIVTERIEQTKGNTLFNTDEDTLKSEDAKVVKQNLDKLKEESFDKK